MKKCKKKKKNRTKNKNHLWYKIKWINWNKKYNQWISKNKFDNVYTKKIKRTNVSQTQKNFKIEFLKTNVEQRK